MASLLNMSGAGLLNKGLPYDAEIEYLKQGAVNSSYIITNIKSSDIDEFRIKTANPDPRRDQWKRIFGSYGNISTLFTFGSTEQGSLSLLQYSINSSLVNEGVFVENFIVEHEYRVVRNNLEIICYQDGIFIKSSYITDSPSDAFIYFFSSSATTKIPIYYAAFYKNGNKIADLIPVRIGQVGYMYDKVSGQLFGNEGTGSFILGPDI